MPCNREPIFTVTKKIGGRVGQVLTETRLTVGNRQSCLKLFIGYLPTNSVYKVILVIVLYVDEEIRRGRVTSFLLENFALIGDFCNVSVVVFTPHVPLKIVDVDPVMTEAYSTYFEI